MKTQNYQIKEFFDALTAYDKIVQNNYMHHQELFKAAKNIFNNISFSNFLDIGCGDGKVILQNLMSHKNTKYYGIDLSGEAINIAKENFLMHNFNAQFYKGDMLEILKKLNEKNIKFDVIFSSLCIHHYQQEEKQALLHEIKKALNTNGLFILIDMFLENNQNRNDFLQNTMQKFYSTLSNLNDIEIDFVKNHVTSCDFPQAHNDFIAMSLNAQLNPTIQYQIEHYGVYKCESN